MHWLASYPECFDLFLDHNNLIFIFYPLSLVPNLSLASMRKVIRRAVCPSIYIYEIIHLSGVDNVLADLISRFTKTPTIGRVILIPPLPSPLADDFEWPSATSIDEEQSKHTKPPSMRVNDGSVNTPNVNRWLPQEATDLQMRLLVIAHTSASDHRRQATTTATLTSLFHRETIEEDSKLFVRSFIHCLSAKY